MSDFQRSPSKVWWVEGSSNWQARAVSSSPGSQDSGFSDAETSPNVHLQNVKPTGETTRGKSPQLLSADILKDILEESDTNSSNLLVNCKDKVSPEKNNNLQLTKHTLNQSSCNASPLNKLDDSCRNCRTPVRQFNMNSYSEPVKRQKYWRNNSIKVNRSLFNSSRVESVNNSNQYAQYNDSVESQQFSSGSEVAFKDSYLWHSDNSSFEILHITKSPTSCKSYDLQKNNSSPTILPNSTKYEDTTTFNRSRSLSSTVSDSESELGSFSLGYLESPRHTSTPDQRYRKRANLNRFRHWGQHLMNYRNKESPLLSPKLEEEPAHVQRWLNEIQEIYEPECMTTLQCKSVSGELAQKVFCLAAVSTIHLRGVLGDSDLIKNEFENIQANTEHKGPIAQSLAGLITEFIRSYDDATQTKILQECDDFRRASNKDIAKLVTNLYSNWKIIQQQVLLREVKKLASELEDPKSELQLRAVVTGITSLTLRHEDLVELFASCGTIQSLCVLCEKCEGSTLRALSLRALSTICYNAKAIRTFEDVTGIQILAETLADESRPEPERSEAVTLLAQVTAPWVEDNYSVRGLQEYMKIIIKGLTKFITVTKCCQNLLLCAAALANLTTMDNKCIKYILHQRTTKCLLEAVRRRGPKASVYLLEQVVTVIANMATKEQSRKHLTEDQAPATLVFCLQPTFTDEEVEKRLQQKSVIAISRLCADQNAAWQIVNLGGVNRLVRLCREKKERYDNDAVLVATLTALRKIVEMCGTAVANYQDIQELVEPRLLDSFLAYSAQNESYV